MSSNNRISFFTSPIGLGHATRDVAVASYLQDDHGQKISFTTGGPAAHLIADLGRWPVRNVYTPPKFQTDHSTGKLKNPARWLWRYYQYYKDCKKIAKEVIELEKPDVVVSDEDFAALGIAQKMKIKNVLVTDILSTKFVSRWPGTAIESKMNRSMHSMMQQCNAVIMPETGSGAGNITRVGSITREFQRTREEIRRAYGFENENEKMILVSVGGTDAGIFLIQRMLKEAASINEYFSKEKKVNLKIVIVTGPSIAAASVAADSANTPSATSIFNKAPKSDTGQKLQHVKVIQYTNNLHELILATDVLVSLAGRSTIDEAASAGTPSVFIPIEGHFEQEQNAAENGGFTAKDLSRLKEIIAAKLEEPRIPISNGKNGAKKTAELIASLQ